MTYKVLGVMSGTSLDGIDFAACEFIHDNGHWKYKIKHSMTIEYNSAWKKKLSDAYNSDAKNLICLDREYGNFIAQKANKFITFHRFKPDLIASHGHTIFHDPTKGYSYQIGHGANIAAHTGIPVVSDFRSTDIALNGQGAPLVPVGDGLLFGSFGGCLNLGGFANISFKKNSQHVAYDICPVNIVLNDLAEKIGQKFDRDGKIGQKGDIIDELFIKLNKLPFYGNPYPKSLSKEWLDLNLIPLLNNSSYDIYDLTRTFYEHITTQISETLNHNKLKDVLVTGGGAHNDYLITMIKEKSQSQVVLPSEEIIDFKEALIFAFLGLLYELGITNCYASVTGAKKDSIVGCLYKSP